MTRSRRRSILSAEVAGTGASRRVSRPARCRGVQPLDGCHARDAPGPGAAGRCSDRRIGELQPSLGDACREPCRRPLYRRRWARDVQGTIAREAKVALVDLTRLAVTYDLMPVEEIRAIVRHAHDKGALVYMDDAGGARVGPAGFAQTRMLELGVDIRATGLDKYGTVGPRLGLLAGRAELVSRVRVTGFELGLEARQMLYPAVVRTLEQYDPARVRA